MLGLLLAACGPGATGTPAIAVENRIECSHGGTAFMVDCAIERAGDGAAMTVRHADGGFRRIAIAADGTLSAADGSDAAAGEALADGRFELRIGTDRYRLPPRR